MLLLCSEKREVLINWCALHHINGFITVRAYGAPLWDGFYLWDMIKSLLHIQVSWQKQEEDVNGNNHIMIFHILKFQRAQSGGRIEVWPSETSGREQIWTVMYNNCCSDQLCCFLFRARNMPTKFDAIFPSKTKRSQRSKSWRRHRPMLWVKRAGVQPSLYAAHTDTQPGLSCFLTVKSEPTQTSTSLIRPYIISSNSLWLWTGQLMSHDIQSDWSII